MIKFDVLNRFSGNVQFTAEIDCEENTAKFIKLGLAVKWGIKNEADLSRADLSWANLSRADLSWANLRWADLRGANLRWADLSWANLRGADLSRADLSRANLRGANLSRADLSWANLRWADLSRADLSRANLRWADLSGANLRVLQTDKYIAYIQKDFLQIGCEKHSFEDWLGFDDKRIVQMDDKEALKWWMVWKPIIISIRETIEK